MLAPWLDLFDIEFAADVRRELSQLHLPAATLFLSPRDELPERIRGNRNPLPRCRRKPQTRSRIRPQRRSQTCRYLGPYRCANYPSSRRTSSPCHKSSSRCARQILASLVPLLLFVTNRLSSVSATDSVFAEIYRGLIDRRSVKALF